MEILQQAQQPPYTLFEQTILGIVGQPDTEMTAYQILIKQRLHSDSTV